MISIKREGILDDIILASLALLFGFFSVIWTGEQLVLMRVDHLTLKEITYLVSYFFWGQLFGGLTLGHMIDRFGSRFIFMVSTAFMLMGFLVFYFFSSVVALEVCSLLLGLSTSCIYPSISKYLMQTRASDFYYYMCFFLAMTSIGCLLGVSGIQYANQYWGIVDSKLFLLIGLSFLFVLTIIDYSSSTDKAMKVGLLNSISCYYRMLKCIPLTLLNSCCTMFYCFNSVFLVVIAPKYMSLLFQNNISIDNIVVSVAFMSFGILPIFINLIIPKHYNVFKTCACVSLSICAIFLYVGSFIASKSTNFWLFGLSLILIQGLVGYMAVLIMNISMTYCQPSLYGMVNVFTVSINRLGIALSLLLLSKFGFQHTTTAMTKASYMQDNIIIMLIFCLGLLISLSLLFPRVQQYSKVS